MSFFKTFSEQIYFNPKYKIIYIDSKLPYVLTILVIFYQELLDILYIVFYAFHDGNIHEKIFSKNRLGKDFNTSIYGIWNPVYAWDQNLMYKV